MSGNRAAAQGRPGGRGQRRGWLIGAVVQGRRVGVGSAGVGSSGPWCRATGGSGAAQGLAHGGRGAGQPGGRGQRAAWLVKVVGQGQRGDAAQSTPFRQRQTPSGPVVDFSRTPPIGRRGRPMTSFPSGARAALALVLAAGCTAGSTPASEWKPFGLQGLTVRSLAASPDLLCAGTQGSGVYCRDLNGPAMGTAWKPLGPAGTTVTWLWIDPVNPLTRFAACGMAVTGPSLYRTMDGGRTWAAVDGFPNPGGPTPRAWAVHGVPGTATVYAAGWTVWVSHDLGNHWAATTAAAGLDCLEVSGADPAVLWSGGETMIFSGFTIRSLDGGGRWRDRLGFTLDRGQPDVRCRGAPGHRRSCADGPRGIRPEDGERRRGLRAGPERPLAVLPRLGWREPSAGLGRRLRRTGGPATPS